MSEEWEILRGWLESHGYQPEQVMEAMTEWAKKQEFHGTAEDQLVLPTFD